ncbi:MAG: shikimate kinase [Planctomycetes bacterium]|nr:shikimate kinase [Planctomycetota bacterium]
MSARAAIALVGLRCVGKTSVGRELARALGLGFVDLDDAIAWADSEGCCAQHIPTVAHVVETLGWDGFRALEARELERVLGSGAALVLATGGGVIERAENRALLRERARVVWLREELPVLRERLARGSERPSLTGASPADELASIAQLREPLYREVADLVLDAAGSSPQELALRLSRALG